MRDWRAEERRSPERETIFGSLVKENDNSIKP